MTDWQNAPEAAYGASSRVAGSALRLSSFYFSDRFGIQFDKHSYDHGLGPFVFGIVRLPSGELIGLVEWEFSKEYGTTIFVGDDASIPDVMREFCSEFGVAISDVSWRRGQDWTADAT